MPINKTSLLTAAIVVTGLVIAVMTLSTNEAPEPQNDGYSPAMQTDMTRGSNPDYRATSPVTSGMQQNQPAGSLDSMAAQLAKRLAIEPNDVDGWVLLGRTYQYMGNTSAANDAYNQAERLGFDASRLAQIRASMATDRQQSTPTLRSPAQSSSTDMTAAMIKQAITKNGANSSAADNQQSAAPFTVSGEVSLAPELAQYLQQGSATLYVFAKAEQGPPMPLAVIKQTPVQLPLRFTLDDSHALMPTNKLSNASSVIVGARISFSGGASAEKGDLEGFSRVVQTTDKRPVSILINQRR